MVDVLSTPLILREIFQNFSSTELLQLSLVNRLWNREARIQMIYRGNFTAHIHSCQDLEDFAYDFRRMKEMNKFVPFSGMTLTLQGFEWDHALECDESSTGELDEDHNYIIDQMTWKNLAVTFKSDWEEFQDCAAFLLVKQIFKKYCCTLEKLSLQVEDNQDDKLGPVLSGCSFPNLKTFRLQKPRYSDLIPGAIREGDAQLIKKVVSNAPNLQVLYTEDPVDLQANLLGESTAVHVTEYDSYLSHLHGIPENGVVDLRMRRMRLDTFSQQFDVQRFDRMAPTLLQSSHTTLSSIEIAGILLVPFARHRVCLQSVRRLCLRFSDAFFECETSLWRLLKSFDFKRIFPNLSTVQVSWMLKREFELISHAFHYMIEQENATLSDPMPDRAANIEKLILDWPTDIPSSSTQLLIQMFPDIRKLSIRADETVLFGRIWNSWLDLKELDITIWGFGDTEKFDSAICGIFHEEAAKLQGQDEEYLRRVNIVPVMPSITCFKRLRTFSLSFEDLLAYSRQLDQTGMFSKVPGLVAFERYPDLTVTLQVSSEMLKQL